MITQRNVVHIGFQRRQRTMPEWIIGHSDIVKISAAAGQILVKPVTVKFVISAIVQMDHDRNIFVHRPHPTNACTDKSGNGRIFRHFPIRPKKSAGQLVSHRHHCGRRSLRSQKLQCTDSIIIYRLLCLFLIHTGPGFWHSLLLGIRPEIAVLDIQQIRKPESLRPLRQLQGYFEVIAPAAIRSACFIIRIVPQPEPDIIRAIGSEYFHGIQFHTVIIKLSATAFYFRQ